MKSTAIAPANIAFIKYWGKQDAALRLPLNDTISMNLSAAYTVTTVEFSEKLKNDQIELIPYRHSGEERSDDSRIDSGRSASWRIARMTEDEKMRVVKHLDRIREQ